MMMKTLKGLEDNSTSEGSKAKGYELEEVEKAEEGLEDKVEEQAEEPTEDPPVSNINANAGNLATPKVEIMMKQEAGTSKGKCNHKGRLISRKFKSFPNSNQNGFNLMKVSLLQLPLQWTHMSPRIELPPPLMEEIYSRKRW